MGLRATPEVGLKILKSDFHPFLSRSTKKNRGSQMRKNGDMIDTSLRKRFSSIVILANKQGFHLNGHSISCEWKIKLSTTEQVNGSRGMRRQSSVDFYFPLDLRANFEIEAKFAFFQLRSRASKFPRIDFYALIYAMLRVLGTNLQETMEGNTCKTNFENR